MQVIKSLRDQLTKLSKEDSRSNNEATLENDEALTPHLLAKEYPKNWRQPKLSSYDGKTNPEDHLHSFIIRMEDVTNRDDIWCIMFRITYKKKRLDDIKGYQKTISKVFVISSQHFVKPTIIK